MEEETVPIKGSLKPHLPGEHQTPHYCRTQTSELGLAPQASQGWKVQPSQTQAFTEIKLHSAQSHFCLGFLCALPPPSPPQLTCLNLYH